MFNRAQMTDMIGRLAYESLPGYNYRGRREGSWFFVQPVTEHRHPLHRWVRIGHSRKKRAFRVQMALSHLAAGHEACLARRLSVSCLLNELSQEAYRYGSKRGAERALEKMKSALKLYRQDFFQRAERTLTTDPDVLAGFQFLEECSGLDPDAVEATAVLRFGAVLGKELGSLWALGGFEEEEPDDEMAAFLSDLKQEGQTASRGQFTLESGRARQKLAQFQLQDPRSFVVHLVAGAVAHGATQLEVYIDSDDVIVDFDGPKLERLELENLFTSLLSFESAQAHLRHWAIGLHGATALAPRWLWFNSQGLVLKLDQQDQELTEESTDQPLGQRIHFRAPVDLTAVKRFFARLQGPLPELEHLRARCRWCPIPLAVGDEVINPRSNTGFLTYLLLEHQEIPWLVPADLEFAGHLERREAPGRFTALFGFGHTTSEEVRFVVNGLRYATPELAWKPACEVTIWLEQATADLSHQSLAADRELMELVKDLQDHEQEFLAGLIDGFDQLEFDIKRVLNGRLLGLFAQGRLSREAADALKGKALLPAVGGTMVSLSDLQGLDKVYFTMSKREHAPLDGTPVIFFEWAEMGRAFRKLFPEARRGDQLLDIAARWHQRYQAWLAMPTEAPELADEMVSKVELSLLPGQVGFGSTRGQLRLLAQGRPLPARSLRDWLPPGVHGVLECDQLEANDDWSDVRPNQARAQIKPALEEALPRLFDLLTADLEDQAVCDGVVHYLAWLAQRNQRDGRLERQPIFRVKNGPVATRPASLVEIRRDDLKVVPSASTRRATRLLGLSL